jgi:nitrogen fixation protein FixH
MAVREITGRHVFIGFAAAFGVIIAVNLLLAWKAVQTFPGLEVKNSYVASQQFDVRKQAQEALGWVVRADHANGMLVLNIHDATGAPVEVVRLEAVLGRATIVAQDTRPDFKFDGAAYVAPVDLAPGNWNIRLVAIAADGTEFSQRVVLHKSN